MKGQIKRIMNTIWASKREKATSPLEFNEIWPEIRLKLERIETAALEGILLWIVSL